MLDDIEREVDHTYTPALAHTHTPALAHTYTPALAHTHTPVLAHTYTPILACRHGSVDDIERGVDPLPHPCLCLYMCTCMASILQAQFMALCFGPLFQTFYSIFSVMVPFSWFCLNLIFDLSMNEKKPWEFISYLRVDKDQKIQYAELVLGIGG